MQNCHLPFNWKSKGFTLIELMVVMAIFSLVVGIGVAQYQTFNRQQKLRAAVQGMITNLRLIQGRALAGEKPSSASCLTFIGFQVSYMDTASYQAQAYCDTPSGETAVGTSTTYTLPPGVVFGRSFTAFRLLAVAEGADAAATIALTDQSATACYGVGISTSGDIVDRGNVVCPVTVTFQVAATYDNVNEYPIGSFDDNYPPIHTERYASSDNTSFVGLRFNNVTIPVGATVTSAQLQLYNFNSVVWGAGTVVMTAEYSGNSPTFSDTNLPSQRTLTSSTATHSFSGCPDGWCFLSEMAPVVQETVNHPAWASGNSLSVILRGAGGGLYDRSFFRSYDGNPAQAARLVVTYEAGS